VGSASPNPAAFPRPIGNNGAPHYEDRDVSGEQKGMTLRDYFAAKALMGNVSWRRKDKEETWPAFTARMASIAYEQADAMLAERARGGAL
jgi:hypothetical protein